MKALACSFLLLVELRNAGLLHPQAAADPCKDLLGILKMLGKQDE